MKRVDESKISRREVIAGAMAAGALAATRNLYAESSTPNGILGPILGHIDANQCVAWMRATTPGAYVLELTPLNGGDLIRIPATADESNDLCLHWHAKSLNPASTYRYRVLRSGKVIAEDREQLFTTAPTGPSKVKLAISSCADEDRGSCDVWNRIAAEKADGVVLIGDTPYIDSTELDVQTRRHREFASMPEYQQLLRSRPCWWTWDDHDFAGNDSDGQAAGKENSRLVFCRYRPQISYGDGREGIYTSFRYGPLEVFMIDTRWFSRTGPSFAAPAKSTLLGLGQWEWLTQGLRESTAPFKLLACGMIWDDKEGRESDHWNTYLHEKRALEKFIAAERIPGVILVGGDIHASRVLRYDTKKTVGYDLLQFIASPIHSRILPLNNVFHPNLIRSAVEPHVFLLVEADSTTTPARLDASLVNRHGERVFTYNLDETQLRPAENRDDS